ncbi:maltase A3-like [Metopolophium dirhodum]|uniref:maltase A3-like n=1 Tax=Metopolophium dirhodum TaxID=44670 RepID=UPI00298FEF2C|nr:maltase A3-like [Metopolophium dirhodum]XP_060865659.1 maltase A3-like [Metopolophium dirhodum]
MKTFSVCCLLMIAYYTCETVNANVYFKATKPNNEWWSSTIFYQVYPRSFKDSNKDGIGDLKGITQKLDHFVDLGIETLWVGPFFKSPMDDMGYDVEDFYMIDPIFGTMSDLEELVFEMNKRNLKLVIDLIPNHSSYKCEWFEKSIKQEGKYKDYYIWHNASNQDEVLSNSSVTPIPPNNWLSIFVGSAWTWNEQRKQFYYHQFSKEQPDFDMRNPDVKQQILDVIEFWMDKGVTGFRFDALKFLYENVSLLDEPFKPGMSNASEYVELNHIYTSNQPEIIDSVLEWRAFMDDYIQRKNKSISSLMSSESYSPVNILMQYYGNFTNPGAQIPFNLALVRFPKDDHIVKSIDTIINDWLADLPENAVANWVIENHDNLRTSSKFGALTVPMFTALKLALPGIDVTYYGSEIGMEDNMYLRPEQITDDNLAGGPRLSRPRDYQRCPMQWDDSINAGFTEEKKSWLPVNPNYYKMNVETQKKIPTSNYNFYKKMSQLRKTETLKNGDLQTYNITQSIYILKRSLLEHESYIVVTNFGSETETVILSNVIRDVKDELFVYLGSENSAYRTGSKVSTVSTGYPLQLRPQSVVVLTDKYIEPETPSNNASSSTESSLKFISFICVFVLSRCFL